MADIQYVQHFVSALDATDSLDRLHDLMEAATEALGFDFYVMTHHVSFGRPPDGAVQLGNYPRAWVGYSRERRRVSDDPVLVACQRTSVGFAWDDLPRYLDLSEEQTRSMAAMRRHGVGNGFTVPSHVPGEILGSCSFAVRTGREVPRQSTAAAQSIGTFAFEAARRIARASGGGIGRRAGVVPLTPRQRDCLVLIARGKSDSVAAQLLGLRPRTVNEYLEAAKRRYAVASRQQLIARALFESQITFAEVLS
jgi:LuxR family transcriptional regulator, quorum-sensing system regulator CciR